MLDPQSWLDAAKELPLGGRRRINHDCGDGRTMIVSHADTAWTAYCWRCSDNGYMAHPQPSLAERIARLAATKVVEEAARATPALPGPANYNPSTWPLPARVWLYKAGLSNERIQSEGFYWCDRLNRVVMPVADANGVSFWQARGFDKGGCKYLSPAVDRSRLAPLYDTGARTPGPPRLVLTEDILSAVRVSEVTPARSIMGTSITDRVLLMVAQSHPRCAVWLDPDGAGRRGAAKIARALALHGVDTSIIRTERDPKCYSREDIALILKERTIDHH